MLAFEASKMIIHMHVCVRSGSDVSIDISFQLRHGSEWCKAEECHTRDDEHPEGLVKRAQEKSVSDQGRENHVGHHHEDDTDSGVDVVRKRPETTEEGEQNDVGAEKQGRG